MNLRKTDPDIRFMREALKLAQRGYGATSPNPMVGAVIARGGRIVARGWHQRAGGPHAEIEALRDAASRGVSLKGAALYVTLEPCCTHGRTPPCTDAIIQSGIRRVVVGATDPNPRHAGQGFSILRAAGVEVVPGILQEPCARLNEAFNHWIVHRTPFVTVKAAMTLDGKIGTAGGESKWITGEESRAFAMRLRQGHDAILVGINTVLADDPGLTLRKVPGSPVALENRTPIRRFILDSLARTPETARVVSDAFAEWTTVVVSEAAPRSRVARLEKRVRVLVAPSRPERGAGAKRRAKPDLKWLLKALGKENVTSLLVEGGGEANASFLLGGFAQRVAFFYAPKILGGRDARKAVGGKGASTLADAVQLYDLEWHTLGPDLFLTASVAAQNARTRGK